MGGDGFMNEKKFAVVLVTVSSREEAEKIASALLADRLAACVNIVPGVTSHFWWQNKIDQADELLLVIKTRLAAVKALTEMVKQNHSYTVPEIIALPVVDGSEDYLNWIEKEVQG